MSIEKTCPKCEITKSLIDFFQAPKDASAHWLGSSKYCISCHDQGLIQYGYGSYGDKYKKPDWEN